MENGSIILVGKVISADRPDGDGGIRNAIFFSHICSYSPGTECVMEIRPTNMGGVANVYRNNRNAAEGKGADSTLSAVNKDVVSFSEEGIRQSEFGKTARAIAAEVFRDQPAERLNELKASIDAGTYSVTSEQIADAILSRVSA